MNNYKAVHYFWLIILILSSGFSFSNAIVLDLQRESLQPDEQIREKNVIKVFNDFEVTNSMTISGDLKIIGGNLIIAGTVNGDIQVLGGDIIIKDTAIINGTIIALGGNIRKSSDANIRGEVLEVNQNKFSFSRKIIPNNSGWNMLFPDDSNVEKQTVPELISTKYRDSEWLRYNRSEGFYFQYNLYVRNEFIPGNIFYGGIGRSFHRNKYYGTIGIEQQLFNHNLSFNIEKYDRAHTDDEWRINRKLNTLAAIFIHEDYYDWYQTDGFQTGIRFHLPFTVNSKFDYRNETQTRMKTVTSWSLFGSNKEFRDQYPISEGQDKSLNYSISYGSPHQWDCNSSFTLFIEFSRLKSINSSDFDYRKDELYLNIFTPFTRYLGFKVIGKAGAVSGNNIGHQHVFQIGGFETLRGFEWKQFSGTQYSLGTIEFVLNDISFFYDRAAIWNSGQRSISYKHWNSLIKSHSGASMGVSIGNKKARLDIIKPLNNQDQDIIINFLITDTLF